MNLAEFVRQREETKMTLKFNFKNLEPLGIYLAQYNKPPSWQMQGHEFDVWLKKKLEPFLSWNYDSVTPEMKIGSNFNLALLSTQL